MAKYDLIKNAFQSKLKPRARLVLNCLILHCNKDGECFPSIKTIAAECGYGVSTVKRALNELADAGYITKQARFDERKKGGQTSNLYTLNAMPDCPAQDSSGIFEPDTDVEVLPLGASETVKVENITPVSRVKTIPTSTSWDFSALFIGVSKQPKCNQITPALAWPGGQVISVPP